MSHAALVSHLSHHDAPEVATAFPDVDDTDDEDDEEDEEDEDEDDDEVAAGVEAAELTVPDAAAVLCCAEPGRAAAIAAAAAALATPAPAVAAASRRLPRRRVRLALDRSSFSVAMTALLFCGLKFGTPSSVAGQDQERVPAISALL